MLIRSVIVAPPVGLTTKLYSSNSACSLCVCDTPTVSEPFVPINWDLYTSIAFLHQVPKIAVSKRRKCQSQWRRRLRRRSATAHLFRFWVRIPPEAWISVCFECCVLSGRGLCDGLITRPEESYRLWCVVVCDLETSWMTRPWLNWGGGCCVKIKYYSSGFRYLTSRLTTCQRLFAFWLVLARKH